jgi:hypothetical protein
LSVKSSPAVAKGRTALTAAPSMLIAAKGAPDMTSAARRRDGEREGMGRAVEGETGAACHLIT